MSPPSRSTPSPAQELADTMVGLWPQAEVSLVSARTGDRGSLREWALVPGLRSPQQLVPLSSPRAASRALRRFSAAASLRSTSARLAAAGATRGTRGAAFGHRLRVHGSAAGSLDEHLAEQLGQPVCWSLGIGPARVNRKPVLQVFDRRGRTLAFGKLGDDDARHDVEAEANALAKVGTQPWRTMLVPRLLSRTEWNGMLVVLTSPLRTSPAQRPADQWHPPAAPTRELADRYARPAAPLAELAWTHRQRATLAGLAERDEAERDGAGRTLACLDRLLERAGDRPTAATAWHGDWAPWNVARAGRHRWQVWDWERFETGVPDGLDRHHWHVNVATRARGESRASLRSGLAAARTTGADRSRWDGAVYLLAIGVRYLWHRERPRGGEISHRTQLVVDELEDLLR